MTAHDPTTRILRHRPTLRPDLAAMLGARRETLCAEMVQSDPRLGQLAALGHPGPVPLNAREMIPDATLRRWMRGEPDMQRGELSADLQGEMALLLQDLAGELLARRYVMEGPTRGARP